MPYVHQARLVTTWCMETCLTYSRHISACLKKPWEKQLVPIAVAGKQNCCHASLSTQSTRQPWKARWWRMVGERTAAARMPVQARYPLISCSVGVSADIQLDSTAATSAPDPTENVASQRCRCVAEDAEKRMAAMYATDALTPVDRTRDQAIKTPFATRAGGGAIRCTKAKGSALTLWTNNLTTYKYLKRSTSFKLLVIYHQISPISWPVKQGFTSSTYTLFSQLPTRVEQPTAVERRSQTKCPYFGDSSFWNVATVFSRRQINVFFLYQLQISQSFSSQPGTYRCSLETQYFTHVHSIPDISMENIKTAKATPAHATKSAWDIIPCNEITISMTANKTKPKQAANTSEQIVCLEMQLVPSAEQTASWTLILIQPKRLGLPCIGQQPLSLLRRSHLFHGRYFY